MLRKRITIGLSLVLAGAMTLVAPAAAHAESNGGVDVNGGGAADGTLVQLWECNGSAAQVWSAR
ncbi:hypothetical protein ACQEVZ_09315 [Dactylosporangium sp. CA-152071]|uniref:hypothetical protein n=1 Tax=Dactylosporangium sp. CA-152071 TaxID=3239933 RepID=UPI003D9048E3